MDTLVLNNESTSDESIERTKELESQIQRLKQEFKQYRESVKRNEEKNKQKMKIDVVKKLVSVADTLDRAIKINNHSFLKIGQKKLDNIKKNMETTYTQLLSSLNIVEISPKMGEELIYEKHIAIKKRNSLYPNNVIIECVRKGYMLDGVVVRPAEVIVSEYSPDLNDRHLSSLGTIRYHPY
ncbi:MAG: nucleotide exchange factor GrpE [Candidatus Thermoplasmatota archaeon]|nr:nucleotide exchange factor GrpE [Candidatus Thermoplasmatota archaeon]